MSEINKDDLIKRMDGAISSFNGDPVEKIVLTESNECVLIGVKPSCLQASINFALVGIFNEPLNK